VRRLKRKRATDLLNIPQLNISEYHTRKLADIFMYYTIIIWTNVSLDILCATTIAINIGC